jgi:hypothetical protein
MRRGWFTWCFTNWHCGVRTNLNVSPWFDSRQRQYASLKRRSTTRLHGAISQKSVIFKTAAIITWYLTSNLCSSLQVTMESANVICDEDETSHSVSNTSFLSSWSGPFLKVRFPYKVDTQLVEKLTGCKAKVHYRSNKSHHCNIRSVPPAPDGAPTRDVISSCSYVKDKTAFTAQTVMSPILL